VSQDSIEMHSIEIHSASQTFGPDESYCRTIVPIVYLK